MKAYKIGGVDLRDDGDIDNDMRDFTYHSA